jgi:hypothetical protein
MTENDRVLDTLARARAWLIKNISLRPNRSATTWRVGFTNVELAYVMGEGTLTLWTDGHKDASVRLHTRGRDSGDVDIWIGALAAVSP